MKTSNLQTIADWSTDLLKLGSSCRRLAASKLPVNLYGARAHLQRRAAALLHGTVDVSSAWEELDGNSLADDERGDRTSLLLGGATGGVALTPATQSRGLLASAGGGTLFLTNIERMSTAAQRVLCRIFETGRYTPVGDPFPRTINCRLIIATRKPLIILAREFRVDWNLAQVLGQTSMSAEKVLSALEAEDFQHSHPSHFAAAS